MLPWRIIPLTDPGSAAILFSGMPVGFRNSIIANSSSGRACHGSNVTVSNSIIEGESSCGGSPITSDPALGSLTGNYYPLLDTSPAIGAGDATYCAQLPTDQIGNERPQPTGSTCDIGAIESARGMPLPTETPTATNTPTSTPTSTHSATATYTASPTATATRVRVDIIVDADCPLPAAVISANTDSNTHDSDCEAGLGDDTIILPAGETTTLSATLNITDNLTINGNGHIISGGSAVRVLT